MLSRRTFVASLLAGAAVATPALGQDDRVTRGVVRQLQEQGFDVVEVQRTLLGRVRILARRGPLSRELVFDRRNGLILRDFVSRDGDGDGPDIPDIGDYHDESGDDARSDDGDDDDDGDDSGDDGGDDDGDDDGGDDSDDD